MRRFKAYILLVVVSMYTFSQFAIVIEFLSNQEFIAKNLCENSEKPELECNGKCYLIKKLKEDKKQKGTEKLTQTEVILYLESKMIDIEEFQFLFEQKESYFNLLEKSTNSFSSDIFHPPILIV